MGEQGALLSMLLNHHARRGARVDAAGNLVAFEDQDRTLWNRSETDEAVALYQKAERIGHIGPYLIQAAIAAEHAQSGSIETTDWQVIQAHYAALYTLQPSPVIRLNLIAVEAKTKGPAHALKALETLDADLSGYRWLHTLRAGLLQDTGQYDAAIAAFNRALDLGATSPERAAIHKKIALCRKQSITL